VGEDNDVAAVIAELEDEMQEAAEALEFERAALLRDQIKALKTGEYRKPAAGARSAKGLYSAPKRAKRGPRQ
jgi:excinuclease ABC subunit B